MDENIILGAVNHTQKDDYYKIIHMYKVTTTGKFIEMERKEVIRDCGQKEVGCYSLVGTEFLFKKMKNLWKWTVVMVAKHYECT